VSLIVDLAQGQGAEHVQEQAREKRYKWEFAGHTVDAFVYPGNRPELNVHDFEPLEVFPPQARGMIWQRLR